MLQLELSMITTYRKIAKTSLVLVYLVIVAGAVVRMTGSGMGCPDWPKCFGYYIPPVEEADLEWQPGRDYKKGQVIIWNEALLVATGNFTTTGTYVPENWTPYTRHDYAVFNASHTWTEFINRLMGALAGLATLVLAIASFNYRKNKISVTILSCLVVFAMGFQAWLGATVVYSVLEPVKITIHMLMALVIVALLLYLIQMTGKNKEQARYNQPIFVLLVISLVLTLVQVVLGTQVRQFVDEQADLVGEHAKGQWLQGVGLSFYIHRSFSLLVLLVNGYLAIRIRKLRLGFTKINWVLALIGLEILSGVAMVYMDFPFITQPLHLVLASLLFGFQFYLILESVNAARIRKTS